MSRAHLRRFSVIALTLPLFLSGCDDNSLINFIFPGNRIACDINERRDAILSAVERIGDRYEMEPYADYSPVEERLVDIFLVDGSIHVQVRSEDDDRIGVSWGVFFPTDPEVERADEIADAMLVALEEACAR